MKHSLTFYITSFIIKLKGIKKDFSKSPIDYKKIRKEDVYKPKGKFFNKKNVTRFKIKYSLITEIKHNENDCKLLIFIHGGAFISGPVKHHWDVLKTISKQTKHTVWMCNYPKAPENKIDVISKNIDSIYNKAIKNYKATNITLIGDSVGATLITTLTQRLVKNNIKLPNKLILVSPVMDATMTNPLINKIDFTDIILSKKGVLSAKKMCAGDHDLKDAIISPLYGEFDNFPPTILFMGTNDIMYPDQKLTEQKLIKAKVDLKTIEGDNMPHIWPFLPVMKEAKIALSKIIDLLNS